MEQKYKLRVFSLFSCWLRKELSEGIAIPLFELFMQRMLKIAHFFNLLNPSWLEFVI